MFCCAICPQIGQGCGGRVGDLSVFVNFVSLNIFTSLLFIGSSFNFLLFAPFHSASHLLPISHRTKISPNITLYTTQLLLDKLLLLNRKIYRQRLRSILSKLSKNILCVKFYIASITTINGRILRHNR